MKSLRVNDRIRVSEVRVVDDSGGQLGIMPITEALAAAEERDLDLVEVAPHENPPVCKIMDYGKFKYRQSKRVQETKRRQRTVQVKEVKLRIKTEEHDYQFKLRHARRFLADGNKAKITVIFRGREMTHTELGRKMLDRVTQDMSDISQVEQAPRLEGRVMSMVLSPGTKASSGGKDAQA
ncbi:MAG: translation initiation factor IF-3 [Nitrospinota bacterium]